MESWQIQDESAGRDFIEFMLHRLVQGALKNVLDCEAL